VQVLDADLSDSPNDPVYHIKLNMSGRQYVAARQHNKLRGLMEELRTRGYRILRPFPEVEDLVSLAPTSDGSGGGLGGSSIPFYEGFGYSIKSLASTMLRSSAAMSLRRRCQLEQISRRIDAFLKAVFLENDDLQYEQQVRPKGSTHGARSPCLTPRVVVVQLASDAHALSPATPYTLDRSTTSSGSRLRRSCPQYWRSWRMRAARRSW
jgi:hypothetical protein